ncbi:MAG: lytic transglycosylase domain-containing protein [Bryobacterales bacterium]|nr:lytic transglycosylase domain-containing protein [Bryobacterales bacterium]
MPRTVFILIVALLIPLCPEPARAQGRQQVTLRTGFTLETDRVEVVGESLVLHTGEGQISVARSDVEKIEDLPWIMPPAPAASPLQAKTPSVTELLRHSAEKHGLPEAFVRSVAEAESALQPAAISPKGARGVMQLMPGTAAALGVNPDEPAENIDGGAKLLRELLLRYQNNPDQVRLALAAYNAGTGAVAKHDGVPPYRETNAYVERVLRRYRAKAAAPAAAPASVSETKR